MKDETKTKLQKSASQATSIPIYQDEAIYLLQLQADYDKLKDAWNYFGRQDKTMFQHEAYTILDKLIKTLSVLTINERGE